MKRLAQAWRERPFLTAAFVLAAVLTVLFTIRTIVFTIYWANPSHRNQPLAAWMTPRYVAHSWHLPPEVVARALVGTGKMPGRRVTLEQIAKERGMTLEELSARLALAAQQYRAEHPQK